jgi:hypothetical protein
MVASDHDLGADELLNERDGGVPAVHVDGA